MFKSPIIEYGGIQFEMREGIFFGMPEKLYHAIPALSNTGFKNLLMSGPDFYFNSWLNPFKDEDAEDDDSKEWQRFGRASHVRILEGKAVFESLYCVHFIAPEGCLDTKEDLKKYLDENGISYKKSASKPELIAAVLFHNPNAMILEAMENKYFKATGGRIQLTAQEIRRIEIASAMIEMHPEMKHYFIGGHAEVTVIWKMPCPHTPGGFIWFKARIDYLKPRAMVDLKSFVNQMNKPIDLAIYAAMANMKYHIQVSHYTEAGRKAIEFARRKMFSTFSPSRFGPSEGFMEKLAESDGHDFYFAFQKKGGAPGAWGKKFSRELNMFKCGEASITNAIEIFRKNLALFGYEIWVDTSPITPFEDALFPPWATEI